ncbi:NYN domain-containing protein [Haliangium ochraceum]|nr:NYN domain-containing protein [Haliangium ochraceum]
MSQHAALLIDLENFYLSRENGTLSEARGEVHYDFHRDLEILCRGAQRIAGDKRLIVRRAYADFNAYRRSDDSARPYRKDYYLRHTPKLLMERGVEPVQVFRFPGGGNKNAADMRLAMDATTLMAPPSCVDTFILVTGDADFIRLTLELRRCGAFVAGIGVRETTSSVLPRYCDRFDYFTDLAGEAVVERAAESVELRRLREALLEVLRAEGPQLFSRIKPLLDDKLEHPFDPRRYGCDNTGDFLRENADALGVSVHRSEYDWEVQIREGGEREGGGDKHSMALYRQLLRDDTPRIYVLGYDEWRRITDYLYEYVNNADERQCTHSELLAALAEEFSVDEGGIEDIGQKSAHALFLLFKSGCFRCTADGEHFDAVNFPWRLPATLAGEIDSAETMRTRAYAFATKVLSRRLALGGYGAADADLIGRLFYDGGSGEHASA